MGHARASRILIRVYMLGALGETAVSTCVLQTQPLIVVFNQSYGHCNSVTTQFHLT
jgi:hypothetical protein